MRRRGRAPTSQNVPAAGGTYSFTVTVSGNGCNWTAKSNASWINNLSATSGTDTTTGTYMVDNNPIKKVRNGTISVAGQTVTISQKRR